MERRNGLLSRYAAGGGWITALALSAFVVSTTRASGGDSVQFNKAVEFELANQGGGKVVIPNINERKPGPSNQAFPFNQGNMRYQQVYAMDQFQGLVGIVTQFAYRVDEDVDKPFDSGPIDTQIWLSHTEAGPNNMSNVFDDNSGPDETLVFDGNLFLSSDGTGDFDIIVDIEDVFLYTGDGNLLIEIKVFGSAGTAQFDAAGLGLGQGGTQWTDRVWAFDPNANTGSQGGDDGMVTSITLAEEEPCPWDLDGNGIVGATDLLALLVSWGKCPGCPADFDDNGIVGATDLLALLVNWGPCP
ncbi:MAG: hypothetical protein V3T84_13825 [Phycisphaerales bacterium]